MRRKILIAEDDADLLIAVALRLRSAGYDVVSAMRGGEVLPLAITQKPDLILLDIGLPERSGHEVACDLGEEAATRRIPVVFLTARHEANHRLLAAEHGAAGYLVKPCRPERLLQAVQSLVDRGAAGEASVPPEAAFG